MRSWRAPRSSARQVTVLSANSDDTRQVADVESLITSKMDVIVIVPHDGKAMAKGVEVAGRAGIPVIAYDRIIVDSALDLYMTFDNEHVGELQGQYILEKLKGGPKPIKLVRIYGSKTDNNAVLFKKGQDKALKDAIASGAVQVVHEDWADDWKPENAKRIMNAAITKNGRGIDAVLASNDGTAGGAIQALREDGLAGKVVVTGPRRRAGRGAAHRRWRAVDEHLQAGEGAGQARRRGRGRARHRQARGRQSRARQRQARSADDPARCGDRDQRQRRLDRSEGRLSHARGNRWEALRAPEPVLEARGLVKRFGQVLALRGVDFDLRPGEVHALCGENGAGKSTLIKTLSGLYPHGSYEGEILMSGKTQRFGAIVDSERAGLSVIHQELALVPEMTVAENVFLGHEPLRFGAVDHDRMLGETDKLLSRWGIDVSASALIADLGVGQRQLVEIAKALRKDSKVLILDEPSAALTDKEVATLLAIVRELRSRGVSSVYISHRLEEVFALSDRITVLRDGQTVITLDTANTDRARSHRAHGGPRNRQPVSAPARRAGQMFAVGEGARRSPSEAAKRRGSRTSRSISTKARCSASAG